jgi:putative transcriptional regulator
MLAAPVLLAQSKSAEDLTAGKLLVAPREAPDPDFAETVILLVRYERGGALGLIVNRPTAIPVSKALRDVKGAGKSADSLYMGGPVDVAAVMALVRATEAPRDGLRIFGDLFVINSKKDMEGALNASKNAGGLRIYVGYCGWSGGQLENEVKLGGWYIFDRSAEAVFDAKPETLWSRLIARTEFRIAGLNRRF